MEPEKPKNEAEHLAQVRGAARGVALALVELFAARLAEARAHAAMDAAGFRAPWPVCEELNRTPDDMRGMVRDLIAAGLLEPGQARERLPDLDI